MSTVKKLRKPTVTQAYNTMVRYFSRPDAKLSKGEHGLCYYRHPDDGRACAVGCLLSDEVAEEMDEGAGSWARADLAPEVRHWMSDETLHRFLVDAQRAHDEAESVAHFLDDLETIYKGIA